MTPEQATTHEPVALAEQVKAALLAEAASGIQLEDLHADHALNAGDLRIESMGFLRVMIALEDDLGIRMDEELLASARFLTVGDVIDFVRSSAAGDRRREPGEAAP